MTVAPVDRRRLRQTIEAQRAGCELAGSPLYAAVLGVVDAEVERGGPVADLLAPHVGAPVGDAVLLRLLGGLHQLVLAGEAPALARHYPSAGGEPGRRLAADVVAALEAHGPALAAALGRGVQTNEPGRSAALVGGYLALAGRGLPLRVLEVGASAGLNLGFDRYRYVAGEEAFGPPDSPLVFDDPWRGRPPDLSAPLVVAERRGSDPAPLDVTDPADRLRLRSFVWPDQLERLARLDAALAVAAAHPPPLDRAGAAAWVAQRLARPAPGRCTVVTHSIVLQYLGAAERRALVAAIEEAGARAEPDAPVAWLRLEPGGEVAELRLTVWPGGRTRTVATSSYHGPPVVWRGPGPDEPDPWAAGPVGSGG